jgi:SHS2 domain-containing protein
VSAGGFTPLGKITILPHTADGLVQVEADNLESLLATSAAAIFELACDRQAVQGKQVIEVEVRGDDELELLVGWLKEVIFSYSTRAMYFSSFKVEVSKEKDGLVCRGKLFGEGVDADRHSPAGEVKMLTYHQLKLERSAEGLYKARLLFDM